MHEELSRLLAGELDPAAEAALYDRIATDPALAEAWATMCALPELLGDLPLEAPPAALTERLVAMTEAFDFEPIERALSEAALDVAPFAPDPREDTIDHAPSDRPRRLAAPRVERSAARPWVRRSWLGLAIAAGALAAALFLAEQVLPSSDLTLPPEGESLVQGDVRVRAGDVRVHVDGRARIHVAPESTSAPDLVIVGSRVASTGTSIAAAATSTDGLVVVTSGHADKVEEGSGPIRSTYATAVATAEAPRTIVTVSVERGTATIESDTPVRISAGETRSVATSTPSLRAVPPTPHGEEPRSTGLPVEDPRIDPDRAVADGPRLPEDADENHVAVAELDSELRSLPEAQWMEDVSTTVLADLDRGDVLLVDFFCEAACVAVYAENENTDWSDLTAGLRASVPEGVHVWSAGRDTADGFVRLYAFSPAPELPADLAVRAVERLEDLEGE